MAERLQQIRIEIDAACVEAGRDPADVQLVAVSKTHPVERVQEAIACGQVHFGESYAQELRDKARALPDVKWHFIGRIQRNKAKYIAPVAHRIHALENVAQAEALLARATEPLTALVAVHLGDEASKGGVAPEEALERCATLSRLDGLQIVGLMTLPPRTDDPQDSAPYFEELADLARQGRARGLPLTELSMGMSSDFRVAIRHGATWIRVGTALFGPRTR